MTGKVYLVGAGPGDPGLITARGLALLESADAVVHDRLVSAELLSKHRSDCEVHDVGKVAGQHGCARQRQICDLLVALAREGKSVVRLKGGDPFVFGRGGEEAEACAEAGVTFEVVPGVTSAIAVPAYAGIPVTHRSVASSFVVVTGHEDPTRGQSRVDWGRMAGIDTIVVLMGVDSLALIVEHLMAHGRNADTPVAVISRGTYHDQRTVTGTLGSIVQEVRDVPLPSPVMIVVGDVVLRREHIGWFDRRSLFGKRILLPRTRDKESVLSDRFRELGAEAVEVPNLRVEPLPERAAGVLERLDRYDLLLFCSTTAVRVFWRALTARKLDTRALAGVRVAAAGPGTPDALHEVGVRADMTTNAYAPHPVAEMVLRASPRPRRVLLLRQANLPAELPLSIAADGVEVDDPSIYRILPDHSALDVGAVHAVVFPSSGSVRTLAGLLNGSRDNVEHAVVACMGSSTAEAAEKYGFRVDAVAEVPTFDGLVKAVLGVMPGEPRDATSE